MASDQHFPFKYFPKNAFVRKIYPKSSGFFAALSVNGLSIVYQRTLAFPEVCKKLLLECCLFAYYVCPGKQWYIGVKTYSAFRSPKRSGYPGIAFKYSKDIYFLYHSTGRLPVPGCTNTHGQHVKKRDKRINDPRSLRIKATFSCEVIHAPMHPCQETGWQWVVWSCIIPGLATHLVQELNVGTVQACVTH